jgi:acyl-CoA hydrolase
MIVIGPNSQTKRPSNVIPMENTVLKSAMVMQPQNRNRHNFMIFGGYLLKETFELAFCCAASFSHSRPTFISLDPSTFENPVPVGSVLYLRATVSYTDPPALSVRHHNFLPTSQFAAIGKEFPRKPCFNIYCSITRPLCSRRT